MIKEEKNQYLKGETNKLLKSKRYKLTLSPDGLQALPSEPGCYILYREDDIVYVGESGNLHRYLMRLRNYPHPARKRIAHLFMKQNLDEKDKRITDFIEKNIEVAVLLIDPGRKELKKWILAEIELI
jgi:hypothetical protein